MSTKAEACDHPPERKRRIKRGNELRCLECLRLYAKQRHRERSRKSGRYLIPVETRGWSISARIGFFTGPREANGCRLWSGGIAKGYPYLVVDGHKARVSRLILGLDQDSALVARHACDNPLCVEPSHLLPGTTMDNKRDAMERRRHAFGERNGSAKLTEAQVLEIRRLGASGDFRGIGRRFGVSGTTANSIFARKLWGHIP